MSLADETLKKYNEGNTNFDVHIENFVSRLQGMAKLHKVTISGDIENLKAGIKNFLEFNADVTDYIKKLKRNKNSNKMIGFRHEGLSQFKMQYADACIAFVKTMKRLNPDGNNVDWRDLVQLLGSLEIEE